MREQTLMHFHHGCLSFHFSSLGPGLKMIKAPNSVDCNALELSYLYDRLTGLRVQSFSHDRLCQCEQASRCFNVLNLHDFEQMSFVKFSFPNCDRDSVLADFQTDIVSSLRLVGSSVIWAGQHSRSEHLGLDRKGVKKKRSKRLCNFLSLAGDQSAEIDLQLNETKQHHLEGLHGVGQVLCAAFPAFI